MMRKGGCMMIQISEDYEIRPSSGHIEVVEKDSKKLLFTSDTYEEALLDLKEMLMQKTA